MKARIEGLFCFKTADISTVHITRRDRELILNDAAPGLRIIAPDGAWSEFVIQHDSRESEVQITELKDFGFSNFFLEIVTLARDGGFDYVRFDADGQEYEDLRQPPDEEGLQVPRSITIKNLTLQFDADQLTEGDALGQARSAIDLINLELQRHPHGMGAQIFSTGIDASDVTIRSINAEEETA